MSEPVKRYDAVHLRYEESNIRYSEGCEVEVVAAYDHDRVAQERDTLRAEVERLRGLINTPHTNEWFDAVRLEAAHQVERWGTDHDAGKHPADWFWLLGYLGGKALAAAISGNTDKAKHHTISSGACLLNWFRSMVGDSTVMRPGIDAALSGGKEVE